MRYINLYVRNSIDVQKINRIKIAKRNYEINYFEKKIKLIVANNTRIHELNM